MENSWNAPVLRVVQASDRALLDTLWQYYELESSAWSGEGIDAAGRFPAPLADYVARMDGLGAFRQEYLILHGARVAGFLCIADQQLRGRQIREFADIYILPGFRGRGIATEVIRQTVFADARPWLICVFRADLAALRFWHRAFARLPFASVAEMVPPDDEDLHEFIVNDDGDASTRERLFPR